MTNLARSINTLKSFIVSERERPFLMLIICLVVFIAISSVFFYAFNIFSTGKGSSVLLAIGVFSCISLIATFMLFTFFDARNSENAYLYTFLITATITGLFFVVLFFPGASPDEDTHYIKPYAYSDFLLGTSDTTESVLMRRTDAELYETFNTRQSVQAYETLKSRFHIFNEYDNNEYIEIPIAVNVGAISLLPQLRIGPTIGIVIGRILNLSGLFTFYLARFLNLVSFILLAFFAIKITPYAKALFMSICLLPMTLFICSTLSYDAGIIGMALLFIAVCFKCRSLNCVIPQKYILCLFILAILLFPCKVVYFFLVFLIFFIPNKNFASRKKALIIKIGLLSASIISVLTFSLPGMISVGFGDKSNIIGRGEGIDRFHSSSEFITDPIRTIFIFANTVFQHTDFYIQSFLGGALGTLQNELKAPWCFIIIYGLILFLAAQRNQNDKTTINAKMKLSFGLICAASAFGILTSMLLAFTLADEMVIYGVQGKYFIPIAPLMLLILRSNKNSLSGDPRKYILFGMFGMNQAYMLFLFEAMLRTPV